MKQISTLTGIRAVAALWVVLFHILQFHGASSSLHLGFLKPLASRGYLGVDLFFMLSGFVLSYVHQADFIIRDWGRMSRFFLMRIARIYPVHLFMLLLYVLLVGAYVLSGKSLPR